MTDASIKTSYILPFSTYSQMQDTAELPQAYNTGLLSCATTMPQRAYKMFP